MQLAPRTVKDHVGRIGRFLKASGKSPSDISTGDIRDYLTSFKRDHAPATYAGMLKSLKVFFRDFMKMEDHVESFRFPSIEPNLKTIPSKEQLRKFYEALESHRDRALFLLYATSGLRMSEILSLSIEDIDLEKRMIIPNKKSNRTKRNWVSFFNGEAEKALRDLKDGFPSEKTLRRAWSRASEKCKVQITPQILREWFCSEMGRLGVQDRYVDAFCGRVPKSILARHYTDYNPERLKKIYEKADLKVLN